MASNCCTYVVVVLAILIIFYFTNFKSSKRESSTEKSFDRELLRFIVPDDQLSLYKGSFSSVTEAVESLGTESRDIRRSARVLTFERKEIDDSINLIIKKVTRDLGGELNEDLRMKIEDMADFALIMKGGKEKFAKVKVGFGPGENTHIIVGGIGFKSVNDDITFGVMIYKEEWKTLQHVRLKNEAKVWRDSTIEQYGKYSLFLNET